MADDTEIKEQLDDIFKKEPITVNDKIDAIVLKYNL